MDSGCQELKGNANTLLESISFTTTGVQSAKKVSFTACYWGKL